MHIFRLWITEESASNLVSYLPVESALFLDFESNFSAEIIHEFSPSSSLFVANPNFKMRRVNYMAFSISDLHAQERKDEMKPKHISIEISENFHSPEALIEPIVENHHFDSTTVNEVPTCKWRWR